MHVELAGRLRVASVMCQEGPQRGLQLSGTRPVVVPQRSQDALAEAMEHVGVEAAEQGAAEPERLLPSTAR